MCRKLAILSILVAAACGGVPEVRDLPGPALSPVAAFTAGAPFCGVDVLPAGSPDPDLHCIRLQPRPEHPDARGWVEMRPAPSPFGVSVDRDGVHVWDLTVRGDDLPAPEDVDPDATALVAWATGANLDPVIRLGEVGEGQATGGRVALDRFLVMVSAERNPAVEERTGPLVLRGTSPSMRMLPHEAAWLFSPDPHDHHTVPEAGERAPPAHHHPEERPGPPALEWRPPPMHPEVTMPAGIGELRPSVDPFLPALAHADHLPSARPTEVVRLADGDTLLLVAGPVARTIGGVRQVLYGFNEQIPGPLIRADRDAEVVVRVRNETAFPTAVHWHGIRLENRFDGVPGVTQDPIEPGDTFTYRVRLPDPGLFWYHPHLREDATQGLGLYGNLRVDPLRKDPALPPVHREETWVLDDLLMDAEGRVFPFGREAATHALMGRFGNHVLVNGGAPPSLEVDRGEIVRFLLTNVAAVRPFNLVFNGGEVRLVAGDLSPFMEEQVVESVPISPAERYVVDVRFDAPGEHPVLNRVRGIDHTAGGFFPEVDTLAVVRVRARPAPHLDRDFDAPRSNREVEEEIRPLLGLLERAPDHELVLTQEIGPLPFPLRPLMQLDSAYFHPVEWVGTMPDMDWIPTANEVRWILRDAATGRENHEIDWRFREGDVVRLRLRNEREVLHAMYHPIHLHGQRFVVLSLNGVPNPNPVWKDTFMLPVGWTAELAVEMSNPGDWMIHCHISEHLESGMHAVFRVDPAAGEWEGWRGFEPGREPPHH